MNKILLSLLIIFNFQFSTFNCIAQWVPQINSTPTAMSTGLNENAGPCLAVSGTTLHVVYSDHRTQGYAIYYQQSPDSGTTWTAGVPITDTMGRATFPVVAVFGSSLHVVWMDSINGIRASCYKRSLDNGNTWSQTLCLDSNTAFWPGVAVSGQMVVVTLNKRLTATNTEVFIMISMDNGVTWGPEQQISNADGRSEDPAIALLGSQIHLSWNDKRSGTMLIYYRHSLDGGLTWGPETPLTNSDSYSSMVSVNGANVDVPCGKTVGTHFHVYMNQSSDSGMTFGASQEITLDTLGDAYPYVVRNGMNLYMVYLGFGTGGGPKYIHSGDGGATWDPAVVFGNGGQPFIAYTYCNLHVIYSDSGHVSYRHNPNRNCVLAGISDYENISEMTVYPNPSENIITVKSSSELGLITIYNSIGELIYQQAAHTKQQEIDLRKQAAGIYILSDNGRHIKIIKE